MAQEYKKYTIYIKEVTLNGNLCKKPSVELLKADKSIILQCIDEDKGKYDIKVDSYSDSSCIDFIVKCSSDECSDCGTEIITKCLCDTDNDCPPCHKCINGFCEEICEDKICDPTLGCVNCVDNRDCPSGLECINGDCVCPSGYFPNLEGDCVECDENTNLDNCTLCINGNIVPKDCPEGEVCDPQTDDCVGCLNSGDCGVNEVCEDNTCVCGSGFIRDKQTGFCVPEEECYLDSDCGDCEVCQNGDCVPQVCPEGFICVPDMGCLPECNCNTRDCVGNLESCVDHPIEDNKCYCYTCSGDCLEDGGAGCGPSNDLDGCICNEDNCEPNPCNGVICPQGFNCIDGDCVDEDCSNNFTLTKNEDCSVTTELTNECCTCPEVSGKLKYNYLANELSISIDSTLEYLKGQDCLTGVDFNDKKEECVALNEFISGGAIYLKHTVTWREPIYETDPISGNQTLVGYNDFSDFSVNKTSNIVDTTTNITEASNVVFSFNPNNSNGEYSEVKRVIEIWREDFTINGAGCTYEESLVTSFTVQGNAEVQLVEDCISLTSEGCAIPLIKYFQDGKVRRKLYTNTEDTISYEESGELFGGVLKMEPCKELVVKSDCACEDGNIDTNFCKPELPIYTFLDECNSEVKITIPPTCTLHAENNTKYIVTVNGIVVVDELSSTDTYSTTYSNPEGTTITEIKYQLVCSNGSIVCEDVQIFDPFDFELTTTVSCEEVNTSPGSTISYTLPTIPDGIKVFITIQGIRTEVFQGSPITLEKGNNYLVETEGCLISSRSLYIPSDTDCNISIDITDPCSCNTRVDLPNGSDCFKDTIVWDISGFDRLIIDSIQGVILNPETGVQYNTLQIQDILDNQSGTKRALTVCVRGQYFINAHTENDNGEIISANTSNSCNFDCCCNVTDLRFIENSICQGEQGVLEITGTGDCNVYFDIIDQNTGSVVSTDIVAFSGTTVYPVNLNPGSWLYRVTSTDGSCGGFAELETSIVVNSAPSYVVQLKSCTVNLPNNEFGISVFSGTNPVPNAIFYNDSTGALVSTNYNVLGLGIYSGSVTPGTILRVEVPADNLCGDFSATVTVDCNCPTPPSIDISSTTFCQGDDITLTTTNQSSQYNVYWSYNNGVLTGMGGNFYIPNPSPNATVEVTYTDSVTNCSTSEVFTLNQVPNLQVAINNTTELDVCIGDTIVLSTNVNGSGVSYNWTIPPGTSSGVLNQPSIQLTVQSGPFPKIVSVDVIDSNGCMGTALLSLNENTCCIPLAADFINIQNITCSASGSSDGQIEVVPFTGTAPYFYQWTGPNGFTANTPIISGLNQPGFYSVLISDSEGCQNDFTYQLIDNNDCITCEEVTLPVDGTFDSCPGSTVEGVGNGDVTCAGFINGNSTADTWTPPLSPNPNPGSGQAGLAEGMIASPQGGTFAGAYAFSSTSGESFYTTINVISGITYEVSFYQANVGNGPSSNLSVQSFIGLLGSWEVLFGNQIQESPQIPYEGAGNQTWSQVTMNFTATSTGPLTLEFKNSGHINSNGIGPNYMGIDGIVVKENC